MDQSRQSHIPGIDALRCFAMVSVLALHLGLFPIGWAGVWVFFVISGFVITGTLMARLEKSPAVSAELYRFYLRRFRRIVPAYLLIIFITAIIPKYTNEKTLFSSLPYLLTFTFNIVSAFDPSAMDGTRVEHLWSISAEQQFYIFFPACLSFFSRKNFKIFLLFIIALSPLFRFLLKVGLSAMGWADLDVGNAVYLFPLGHFDGFAAGALIAMLYRSGQLARRHARLLWWGGCVASLVYLSVYIMLAHLRLGVWNASVLKNLVTLPLAGDGREAFLYSIIVCFSAACLVSLLTGSKAWATLTSPRALRYIGEISYGCYLFHGLAIYAAASLFPGLYGAGLYGHACLFLPILAMTVGLAALSFHFFETPILRGVWHTAPLSEKR